MSGAQQRRHDVVQVTGYYPPNLGGLENVVRTISELLAERHDVRVITTSCGSDRAPHCEDRAGVQVRRSAGITVAHTPLSFGLPLWLLKVGRRSIVHVHIAHAFVPEVVLLSSILRRHPYIAHFHVDVDPTGPFGVLLKSYKRWILGPCLRRAAAVIALSDQQAGFLESHYAVLPDRITVIPNGVDPAFYRPPSDGEERTAQPRVLRMLYVGRLDVEKCVQRLVDAMTHVSSDVELVIVGEGSLRDEITRQISRLGLSNVKLVGVARGAELVRWYRWADAFVLPSDREGMPLVVLEAMAAALAVVATDVPGTREVVRGVGLLTQPNAESLGAAIERLAADPGLLSTLSARSAARGIEFDWDASIVELERLYDSIAVK